MDILKKKQTQKDYSCILFFFFLRDPPFNICSCFSLKSIEMCVRVTRCLFAIFVQLKG